MKYLRFYRRQGHPKPVAYPQAVPGRVLRLEPAPGSLFSNGPGAPHGVERVPDDVAARMGFRGVA